MRPLLFLIGILLLIVPEVLRVYYIMPFPGSQEDVATDLRRVNIAYWLHTNIWWLRLVGVSLLVWPLVHILWGGRRGARLAAVLSVAFAGAVIYLFNFRLMADAMFLPMGIQRMGPAALNETNEHDLVLGVEQNGEARAYPIELIGYHHQVVDTIGGEAVMVTYCTVCRSGRVFRPVINLPGRRSGGVPGSFRLVGMDHLNAMFEDTGTKSWWRQATGECIVGPLKGLVLEEVPARQMTLGEWTRLHPNTLVLQPDPGFREQYAGLDGYDEGTIASSLEGRDTASWRPKSWVVGVVHNGMARAYDWNELERNRLIGDTLGGDSVLLTHGPGPLNYNAYRIMLVDLVEDSTTGDVQRRFEQSSIPAYQEFWHSWRTFHPNTTQYVPKQ